MLADLQRFARGPVRAFEVLFGLALASEVATDAWSGGWAVHEGALYPWRWIRLVPLYPTWLLAIVWGLQMLAGILLAAGVLRPIATRLAALVTFAWVVERYSNHGALLFLVSLYLALEPPRPDDPRFAVEHHGGLALVRAQLVLVYVFSAVNKLLHGFARGASLVNLLGVPLAVAQPLAAAVVFAELLLPVLLLRWPRLGVAGVVLLHAGFCAVMPGLWSFALAMTAMATLFLREPPAAVQGSRQ